MTQGLIGLGHIGGDQLLPAAAGTTASMSARLANVAETLTPGRMAEYHRQLARIGVARVGTPKLGVKRGYFGCTEMLRFCRFFLWHGHNFRKLFFFWLGKC